MQPSVRSIDSLGIAFAPVYIALVSQIDLHPLRPCPGFSRPKPKPPKISKDFLFKDVISSKAARSESKEKRVTRSTLAVYLFTFSGANGEGYFCNTSGGAFQVNLPAGTAGSIISVQDLISYRNDREKLVEELTDIDLPTSFGDFSLKLFEDKVKGDHHLAIIKGKWKEDDDVIVRVHSQCLTGDIFQS